MSEWKFRVCWRAFTPPVYFIFPTDEVHSTETCVLELKFENYTIFIFFVIALHYVLSALLVVLEFYLIFLCNSRYLLHKNVLWKNKANNYKMSEQLDFYLIFTFSYFHWLNVLGSSGSENVWVVRVCARVCLCVCARLCVCMCVCVWICLSVYLSV